MLFEPAFRFEEQFPRNAKEEGGKADAEAGREEGVAELSETERGIEEKRSGSGV